MTAPAFPREALRAAILSSIPDQVMHFGDQPPELRDTYLPRAHVRALGPDAMLVSGAQGMGKSVWWSALQDPEHRAFLGERLARGALDVEVTPGFGPTRSVAHPSRESLQLLAPNGLVPAPDPADIWRAVVLHQVLDDGERASLGATWVERVEWARAHPEEAGTLLFRADQKLRARGSKRLIVFDALDRTADDWPTVCRLLRGLLQLLLELRGSWAIRAKAFVRPDLLADARVTSFPDAAKVLANEVTLTWPRTDLYGLLWQHLANAEPGGTELRIHCSAYFRRDFESIRGVWVPSGELLRDEEAQSEVFEAMVGPYMGAGPRSGSPYTWLHNHLADARGQVTPGSFLTALRSAAQDEPTSPTFALDHRALRSGVVAASKLRAHELGVELSWVRAAMAPLRGLSVPFTPEELAERWTAEHVLESFEAGRLGRAPLRAQGGHESVIEALEDLGVFRVMSDGRVNVPEVYRLGFGVGRKGAQKPLR